MLLSEDFEHFVHDDLGPSFTDAERDYLVQSGALW
jgi:hypothetical protein